MKNQRERRFLTTAFKGAVHPPLCRGKDIRCHGPLELWTVSSLSSHSPKRRDQEGGQRREGRGEQHVTPSVLCTQAAESLAAQGHSLYLVVYL